MDAEKRRSNDVLYDWWSSEGDHKLIMLGGPTKQSIAMANQWHEYFLWRPTAEKAHAIRLLGPATARRVKIWSDLEFYDVFFKPFLTPYCGWAKNIDQYSDERLYQEYVEYTIVYDRVVDSPYLKEFGKIQDECEELVHALWLQYEYLNEANTKLSALLPFGKAEARQKKEKAEKRIPQLREQIDQQLARANEIRAIILGR